MKKFVLASLSASLVLLNGCVSSPASLPAPRMIAPGMGQVSILMGEGSTQPTVEGLALARPAGIAVDANDRVYVSDLGNSRVLRMEQDGTTKTWLDKKDLDEAGFSGEVGGFEKIAAAPDGTLYVGGTFKYNVYLWKITSDGKPMRLYEQMLPQHGDPFDNGNIGFLKALAVSPNGSIWAAGMKFTQKGEGQYDQAQARHGVYQIAADGKAVLFAGEGAATLNQTLFDNIESMAFDVSGNLFLGGIGILADEKGQTTISPQGVLSQAYETISIGDKTQEPYFRAYNITMDNKGTLYGFRNKDLHKISSEGRAELLANHLNDYFQDLASIEALAADSKGNVYISDQHRNRVLKVTVPLP